MAPFANGTRRCGARDRRLLCLACAAQPGNNGRNEAVIPEYNASLFGSCKIDRRRRRWRNVRTPITTDTGSPASCVTTVPPVPSPRSQQERTNAHSPAVRERGWGVRGAFPRTIAQRIGNETEYEPCRRSVLGSGDAVATAEPVTCAAGRTSRGIAHSVLTSESAGRSGHTRLASDRAVGRWLCAGSRRASRGLSSPCRPRAERSLLFHGSA